MWDEPLWWASVASSGCGEADRLTMALSVMALFLGRGPLIRTRSAIPAIGGPGTSSSSAGTDGMDYLCRVFQG
jgi:hypothetical protein